MTCNAAPQLILGMMLLASCGACSQSRQESPARGDGGVLWTSPDRRHVLKHHLDTALVIDEARRDVDADVVYTLLEFDSAGSVIRSTSATLAELAPISPDDYPAIARRLMTK